MTFAIQQASPFGAFRESPLHARGAGAGDFAYIAGAAGWGLRCHRIDLLNSVHVWTAAPASTAFGHPCIDSSNVYCSTVESSGQLGIRAYTKSDGTHLWTWSDANPAGGAIGHLRTFVRNGYVYGAGHWNDAGTLRPYLAKLDTSDGSLVWEIKDATANRRTSHGLWVDSDDIVWLCSYDDIALPNDGWIIKIGSDGVELTFVETSPLRPTDIWQLSSGDFIVTGFSGGGETKVARYTSDLTNVYQDTSGGSSRCGLVIGGEVWRSLISAIAFDEASIHDISTGAFSRSINLSGPSLAMYLDRLNNGDALLLCRPSGLGTYPNQELFRLTMDDPIAVAWAENLTTATMNGICTKIHR